MSGNDKLPPEIVHRICIYLSQPDLKKCRLLSHKWDNAAQRELFSTVYLEFNVESYVKVQYIVEHERLRKHVRVLAYDGFIYAKSVRDTAKTCFSVWKEYSRAAQHIAHSWSLQQLEMWHYDHCTHIMGVEYLLYQGEKRMLLKLFQLLPSLTGIKFGVGFDCSTDKYLEAESLGSSSFESLSSRQQQFAMMAKPYSVMDDDEDTDEHFWEMLQCASLSNRLQELKSICGSELVLEHWAESAPTFSQLNTQLPALRHLSLEFRVEEVVIMDRSLDPLRTLMVNVPHLISLRLSFKNTKFDIDDTFYLDSKAGLNKIIPEIPNLHYLQSLSLEDFETPQLTLQCLLEANAHSLRSLELSNIYLGGYQDSWVLFIDFLSQNLSLAYVKLDGYLSNKMNEGWETRECNIVRPHDRPSNDEDLPPAPYADDCLRYCIQRFILYGGLSPFLGLGIEEGDSKAVHWKGGKENVAGIYDRANEMKLQDGVKEESEVMEEMKSPKLVRLSYEGVGDSSWRFEKRLIVGGLEDYS